VGEAGVDARFTGEAFASEYATFLRIARSTVEDTGMGEIEEHILTTPSFLALMRRLPDGYVALLVSSSTEHLGRLRYELKRSLLYSPFLDYEPERTKGTHRPLHNQGIA
jgi:predicted regulator of Ras-like GTPase activity (Roadblock/LC7/MglB family)